MMFFPYFSMKIDVVTPQQNCLIETVLMSGFNIQVLEEFFIDLLHITIFEVMAEQNTRPVCVQDSLPDSALPIT